MWSGLQRVTTFACLFLLAVVGCAADPVPLSPQARTVQARKGDPPAGAREMGAIQVAHGNGCGGFGAKGSLEGAMALLRNRAASMGADYVQIMTMTEPHLTSGCMNNEFSITGIAYQLGAAHGSQPLAPAVGDCNPPCSPGYGCNAAVCIPLCNPACAPDEHCNGSRMCEADKLK